MKRLLLFALIILFINQLSAQHLVGYWQNWNDVNAPYISLDQIDSRYTVVNLAFPLTQSGTDYDMYFTPCCGETEAGLISKIQTLQANGVIVNMSIGGATIPIELDNATELNTFVSSMNNIINTYGLDGVDIDLEGSSLHVSASSSIANPTDVPVINMISAIQQIGSDYQTTYGKKMFLSSAPETAFVQGGQGNWGGIWGAYLPLLDALRNDIDLLHVQLYNSGSMFGLDGNIYAQGTADFIVSQTEVTLQGFTAAGNGGAFAAFDQTKIGVGLPACPSAAGGGFTAVATVKSAIEYLQGVGSQPGSYVLQGGPYPNLGGLMTWSINWDAVATCNSSAYEFAANYEDIFDSGVCWQPDLGADISSCGINFPYTLNSGTTTNPNVTFTWKNLSTNQTLVNNNATANTLNISSEGIYQVQRDSSGGCSKVDNITVSNDLPTPDLPASENLCSIIPWTLTTANAANFPVGTTYQWYKNNVAISGETNSSLTNIREAADYKMTAQKGACISEETTTITSDAPTPIDGCAPAGNQIPLSISTGSIGPFSWYENASGGSAVGTGTNFTTPILNSTTTYYVEDESSLGSATTGHSATGNGLGTLQNWLQSSEITFDAAATFTLKEITVYPLIWCNTHTFSFEIRNSAGTVLTNGAQSFSITDNDGNCSTVSDAVTLTLSNGGVEIPQGTGYKIVQTGGIGFNHWEGSVTYPMDFSPYFSITAGNISNKFMAIHNWVVEGGNCARMPVIAEVDPSCSAVLAVELSNFSTHLKNENVILKWRTEMETNNKGFHIQRRTNDGNFENIGWVNAKNETQNTYQFLDKNIEPNTTYYYQLKQEDLDGSFYYSNIEIIQTEKQIADFQLFPNPTNDVLNIHYANKNSNFLPQNIQIFNTQGMLVFEQKMENLETILDLQKLPKGIYLLKILNLTDFRFSSFWMERM